MEGAGVGRHPALIAFCNYVLISSAPLHSTNPGQVGGGVRVDDSDQPLVAGCDLDGRGSGTTHMSPASPAMFGHPSAINKGVEGPALTAWLLCANRSTLVESLKKLLNWSQRQSAALLSAPMSLCGGVGPHGVQPIELTLHPHHRQR